VTSETFAWLARLHGHAATLGLAVLLHPVITLRLRGRVTRGAQWSADLGALLLLGPGLLGAWVYGPYRLRVKPALWLVEPGAVLRFETKEHLAAMAIALAAAGAITLRVGGRSPPGRETAWSLLASAWLLGVITGLLGLYVSGRAQPGW
jgi:hypothetical protein